MCYTKVTKFKEDNQMKLTPKDLSEMEHMQNRFAELYAKTGLIAIHEDGVFLSVKTFFDTFSEYDIKVSDDDFYVYSKEYPKFYALLNKKEYDEYVTEREAEC